MEKDDSAPVSWLMSGEGIVFQFLLCTLMVVVNAYTNIFQKIATGDSDFDAAGININVSLISILIAVITAMVRGELHIMFERGWAWKTVLFSLPGVGFIAVNYLDVLALRFLDADMQRVTEQSQLLMTSTMSTLFLGRRYAVTEWVMMIVVTFSTICYSALNFMEKGQDAGSSRGAANDSTTAGFGLGVAINLTGSLIGCTVSILSEKLLKEARSTPFYIQKFYIEMPGAIFAVILTGVINPILKEFLERITGDDSLTRNMKSDWFEKPWQGFGSPLILAVFVLMVFKSWVAGLLVKVLSSVTKLLCGVIVMGITYPLGLIHLSCPDGSSLCPGNLRSVTFPMVVADLLVMISVTATVFAGRDRKGRTSITEELEDLKIEYARLSSTDEIDDVYPENLLTKTQ